MDDKSGLLTKVLIIGVFVLVLLGALISYVGSQ